MTIIPNLSTQISPDQFVARDAWLKSLSRLNSGGSAATRPEAAAPASAELSLSAQIRGTDFALKQVSDAISFSQTQSSYVTKISNAFERMSVLAGFARDDKVPAEERNRYQKEFSQLSASVTSASTKQFNGINLFSGNALEIVTDSHGHTLSLPGVSLDQPVYADALRADLTSDSGAQAALAKLQLAGRQLALDRAAVDDNQARLSAVTDELAVSRENLDAAASGIPNGDAAEEFTQFARQNIVAQPGTAMLAQANAMPQRALRLLP